MNLYTKDVEKIGFKGSGLFDDSKWYHFYYSELPKSRQIYIIDDLDKSVSHFNLSEKEWEEFKNDKLSLTPIGCVCASGNKFKENPTLDFQGDFKKVFGTRKKTLAFIKKIMQDNKTEEIKRNQKTS